MSTNITQETLDEFKKSFTQPATATSGLATYSLEAPSKKLFPVLTPLRNEIARIVGGSGIQANWRVITGINTGNVGIGLSEGQRGYGIEHDTAEKFAKFCFLGLNDSVTFEAELAGRGFEDVRATASTQLLNSLMIQEEFLDYAGNGTLNLGKTPAPVLSTATSGGSLAATTEFSVIVVALSQRGWQQVAGFNNGTVGQSVNVATAALVPTFARVDLKDGATKTVAGGVAQKSDAVAITTGAGTSNSITVTVSPVAGAFGYAYFWGVAGSEVLGAVSHLNVAVIKTVAGGSVAASAFTADNSKDEKVYDGLLTQIVTAGSGAYVRALAAGSDLTSDGAGGIVEIEEALAGFYDQYKLSPEKMYVSAKLLRKINKLIIANGGAPLIRFNGDMNGSNSYNAGTVVANYLNKSTNTNVKIEVHPNAAPGTIMFFSNNVPYKLSGVSNVVQKLLRRDYYQIDWPLRSREFEFGIFFDGVLQNYFTPAFGLIYNIAE